MPLKKEARGSIKFKAFTTYFWAVKLGFSMIRLYQVIMFITFFLGPLLSKAQKIDTVTFFNGDRAVCEIKSLRQGKLSISTVAMGTISVEWRKVSNVKSKRHFEIILSDHSTFFGRIDGVDSLREATLSFGIFVRTVPLKDIVGLNPIREKFWKKLDGSLSMGFSFTKGTENLQFNSSGDASYRTKRSKHTLSYNTNISENTATRSKKQDVGYRYQLFYKRRIYNALDIRWEQNTELGINSRLISTLSVGYNPLENNINVFSFEVGGSGNNETTSEGSSSYNMEGLIRFKYDLFIFANPKIFINIITEAFPSFTIKDRIRSNLDAKITWEVFSDFTLGMSYWFNSDSKPADANALNFDWGYTTSIGYTF